MVSLDTIFKNIGTNNKESNQRKMTTNYPILFSLLYPWWHFPDDSRSQAPMKSSNYSEIFPEFNEFFGANLTEQISCQKQRCKGAKVQKVQSWQLKVQAESEVVPSLSLVSVRFRFS